MQLRLDAQQSRRIRLNCSHIRSRPTCRTRQTAQPSPSTSKFCHISRFFSSRLSDPDHAFILIPARPWPNHVIYHVCRIKAVAGYKLPHVLRTRPTRVSSHVFVRHVSISRCCLRVCVPITADTRVFVIGPFESFLVLILCLSSVFGCEARNLSTSEPTADSYHHRQKNGSAYLRHDQAPSVCLRQPSRNHCV